MLYTEKEKHEIETSKGGLCGHICGKALILNWLWSDKVGYVLAGD